MKWAEPPDVRPSRAWQPEADELRAHPGEWGLIVSRPYGEERKLASQLTYRINQGQVRAFAPAGSFRALCRKEPDDEGKLMMNVYVRFTGDEHAS